MATRQNISACVITFNRAAIVPTCLRAVGFADEVILVDKTSTDATRKVTAGLVDRAVTVPWSPTVEETRAHAVSLCRHPWILLLDDDECLSPEAAAFIEHELRAPRADIYVLPLRHYILGVHDERAYYWPEHHVRLFRRDAVAFEATVHGGMVMRSDRIMTVPHVGGVCVHHLSHPDVASWLERTNRYTSRPDRRRTAEPGDDLAAFAHERIAYWTERSADRTGDGYPLAVAVLRALYDIADGLKMWEETHRLNGAESFRALCAELDRQYPPRRKRGRDSRRTPFRVGPALTGMLAACRGLRQRLACPRGA